VSDGNLRKYFRKHLPEVFWTSVESRLTEQGIPDLHGIFEGSSFWIENKKARGNSVRFQLCQPVWLGRYCRNGGRCFVAVRRNKDLWLVHGWAASGLQRYGLASMAARNGLAGYWQGGPRGWHWPAIRAALVGASCAPQPVAGKRL
jgi:hypothetical protein